MRILIATKNKGKFGEISGVLESDGVELVFLGDLVVSDEDFSEDGITHAENSYKKAAYYFDKLGADFDYVLGEDSGIYVDALASELGVKTRRWGAGEGATDEEWLEYFMKEMDRRCSTPGLPRESQELQVSKSLPRDYPGRGAKFVCNACLIGDGVCEYFEGETLGRIVDEVSAAILPGLPLSSVFLPDGFDRVYAALTREEKNAISHRGQAISKVKKHLTKKYGI